MLYAGVDGGGTRTRVMLTEASGRVVGWGLGASTNLNTLPEAQVREHLQHALEQARERAGVAERAVEAIGLGMAGVNSAADERVFEGLVGSLEGWRFGRISVSNDTITSLLGGLEGGEGLVLISGTGSNCLGRRRDGRTWQAGGLEYLIDDGGSAFDLARRGLIAAVRAADRRGPPTTLERRLFDALGVKSAAEVPRLLHVEGPEGGGRPMTKAQIAALAPIVVEEAARDGVASGVVALGAVELRLMIGAVVQQLGFEGEVPVCVVGSTGQDPLVWANLERELRQHRIAARLQRPGLPPVAGGVLRAFELAGLALDEPRLRTLRESLPRELR